MATLLAACSGLQQLKTGAKNIFAPPSPQELRTTEINNAVEAEIAKLQETRRERFLLDLDKPFSTYEEARANFVGQFESGFAKEGKKFHTVYPVKANMIFNAMLYDDLGSAENAMEEANESLQLDSCNPRTTEYILCLQNSKYKSLIDKIEAIKKVREGIHDYSYEYERDKFVEATGFDPTEIRYLVSTLTNYMAITPKKGEIYSLDYANPKVVQNVRGGVLVASDYGSMTDIYADKMAFIYTNKKFVDGQILAGLVKYVGTYDYKTVLGANKTVYAFRFFNLKYSDYGLKEKDFFFYPESKALEAEDMIKAMKKIIIEEK
jgi:hypothetical protein